MIQLYKDTYLNCKFKCHSFFSEEDKTKLNQELNWKDKRMFVMNSTENKIPRRKVEQNFYIFLKRRQLYKKACL